MAELTPKTRRRGLDFAEEIASLAAKAFDDRTKKELYAVVHSVRKRYGYTEAEKETEILRRIAMGASSVNDIVRETGFNSQDVWRIVKLLEEGRRIRSQMLSNTGKGRPVLLFFAVESIN